MDQVRHKMETRHVLDLNFVLYQITKQFKRYVNIWLCVSPIIYQVKKIQVIRTIVYKGHDDKSNMIPNLKQLKLNGKK